MEVVVVVVAIAEVYISVVGPSFIDNSSPGSLVSW